MVKLRAILSLQMTGTASDLKLLANILILILNGWLKIIMMVSGTLLIMVLE
jgi:hypothetical protein